MLEKVEGYCPKDQLCRTCPGLTAYVARARLCWPFPWANDSARVFGSLGEPKGCWGCFRKLLIPWTAEADVSRPPNGTFVLLPPMFPPLKVIVGAGATKL